MVEGDRKRFAGLMAVLAEVFSQGEEPSPQLMDIYWEVLSEFSIGEVEGAVKRMIRERKYPSLPKPAELIEAISGPAEDRATEAWLEVLHAMRRIGPYRSVRFADPVIHSAIDAMGGWIEFGNMLLDEEKWKQKEFERFYQILEKRGGHPAYLAGIHEIDNGSRGYHEYIEPPVPTGSKRKVLPGSKAVIIKQ